MPSLIGWRGCYSVYSSHELSFLMLFSVPSIRNVLDDWTILHSIPCSSHIVLTNRDGSRWGLTRRQCVPLRSQASFNFMWIILLIFTLQTHIYDKNARLSELRSGRNVWQSWKDTTPGVDNLTNIFSSPGGGGVSDFANRCILLTSLVLNPYVQIYLNITVLANINRRVQFFLERNHPTPVGGYD